MFQKSFGTSGVNAIGSFQLSQLNSSSVKSKLKAAGINTNSKQYKAAVKQMMSAGNGAMYGNIQGIKNLMSHYDKDGDYINPVNGLAGLLVTDENESSRKRIISIPYSSKEEMYELTKKEFLCENGVHNGDTTKKTIEIIKKFKRKGGGQTPLTNVKKSRKTGRFSLPPPNPAPQMRKLDAKKRRASEKGLKRKTGEWGKPPHRHRLNRKSDK